MRWLKPFFTWLIKELVTVVVLEVVDIFTRRKFTFINTTRFSGGRCAAMLLLWMFWPSHSSRGRRASQSTGPKRRGLLVSERPLAQRRQVDNIYLLINILLREAAGLEFESHVHYGKKSAS